MKRGLKRTLAIASLSAIFGGCALDTGTAYYLIPAYDLPPSPYTAGHEFTRSDQCVEDRAKELFSSVMEDKKLDQMPLSKNQLKLLKEDCATAGDAFNKMDLASSAILHKTDYSHTRDFLEVLSGPKYPPMERLPFKP